MNFNQNTFLPSGFENISFPELPVSTSEPLQKQRIFKDDKIVSENILKWQVMFSVIRLFIAELFSTMQFAVQHYVDFLEFTISKVCELVAYVIRMYGSVLHLLKTGLDIVQSNVTKQDDHLNKE